MGAHVICSVAYCGREDWNGSGGLCSKHATRKRRGNPNWDKETPLDRGEKRLCSHPGCGEPHDSHGYCGKHSMRLRKGRPLDLPNNRLGKTEAERFWEKVDKHGGFVDFTDPLVRVTEADGECWLWTAFVGYDGYGRFGLSHSGGVIGAHRWSNIAANGPMLPGEDTDHLCRRRICVNPSHLETVRDRVNILRGNGGAARNARKTHCKWGHELAGDNVRVYRCDRKVERVCLACKRMQRNPNWRELIAAPLLRAA